MDYIAGSPENETIRQAFHELADYKATGLTADEVNYFINSGKGKLSLELKLLKEENAALRLYREEAASFIDTIHNKITELETKIILIIEGIN